ncbi:DUF2807 domain-containing protein [Maribacter sp.]|nr:DUF2807 domain-containing protein [Maribacter sp.]
MQKTNLQLIALSMVFLFLSCSKDDTLRGSGNSISESRALVSFTKVYNPTSVNIVILEGATQQVELTADDNVISSINTIVEEGTLKIDLGKRNYVDAMMSVSITIPNLEELKNTGSGNMTASGFDEVTNLVIGNEGSGTITLDGSGTALSIKNSGSGSYQGFGFAVNSCTVSNSGSGNCEISCVDTLSGSNSGSGSVFYKGTATVAITSTGSGEVVDSN